MILLLYSGGGPAPDILSAIRFLQQQQQLSWGRVREDARQLPPPHRPIYITIAPTRSSPFLNIYTMSVLDILIIFGPAGFVINVNVFVEIISRATSRALEMINDLDVDIYNNNNMCCVYYNIIYYV